MKKLEIFMALSGLILILSQCSQKVTTAQKVSTSAIDMDKKYVAAHFSTTQLEEGKTLFTNNCGRCHQLFTPETFTVLKWNHEVTDMLPKTKLTAEDGAKIRAYVIANAK